MDGAADSSPELRTSITDLLQIRHPVVLAPMGGVAGGALAAAVSAAGGLGMVGVGYQDRLSFKQQLKAAGGSRVGSGFITWLLAKSPDLLDMALERHPPAIMLSFGDVGPFAEPIRRSGAHLICQVSSVRAAAEALDHGADLLVAQGSEGGGHGTHRRSTVTLLPEICDLVSRRGLAVPVLAAGGIADGRGVAAALMLGASGVVVGTRFAACSEALAPAGVQERIVGAGGDDTIATTVYDRVRGVTWPDGYTSRVLRSPFTAAWHGRECQLDHELGTVAPKYQSAVRGGDFDTAVVTAGEAVGLVHSRDSAAQVVLDLVAGATARLARGSTVVREQYAS